PIHSSPLSNAGRLAALSGFDRFSSRAHWHLRTALFPLHLCRLDLLRPYRRCAPPPSPQTSGPYSPLSRLGLSLDDPYLLPCRNLSNNKSLAEPPFAFNTRSRRHPRGHSFLFPMETCRGQPFSLKTLTKAFAFKA